MNTSARRVLAVSSLCLLLAAACGRRAIDPGPPGPAEQATPAFDPEKIDIDPACTPGTAGCPCAPTRAQCDRPLSCFGGYCYGGDVPAPDTYFYDPRQFDDVELVRQLIFDRLPLRPGLVMADIGVGHGWFAGQAATRLYPGGRVIATDIAKRPLDFTEGLFSGLRLAGKDVVRLEARLCADGRDPAMRGVPDGSVDLMLMINSLTFLDDPPMRAGDVRYLRELARVLRPGGRLVLHNDWAFPNALGRAGVEALFVEAGFAADPEEIPMPAHIPAQTFFEDKPGGKRHTLRRGWILAFAKPGAPPMPLAPAVVPASGEEPAP